MPKPKLARNLPVTSRERFVLKMRSELLHAGVRTCTIRIRYQRALAKLGPVWRRESLEALTNIEPGFDQPMCGSISAWPGGGGHWRRRSAKSENLGCRMLQAEG